MLHSVLPYVIAGLVSGAVYGLAGTGLVLTYKTTGIFNFAYGSIAAIGVFVFYWLRVEHGLPWAVAALICLAVLAPVEGILLELLGRALERQGTAVKVVATVGLLLIVLGVGGIWYGSKNGATVPQYLPTETFSLGGVEVTWGEVIVFVVAVLGAGTLYYFFRYFRLGMAMRGIVDDPDLVDLNGESPTRVRRLAWVIGTIFATLAGLLISPSLSLDASTITLLVVQAFGAAAIGYFTNLPLTFIGGLIVGLLTSFGAKYSVDVSWLSGLPAGIPFIVLFLVLVFMPSRRLAERRSRRALALPEPWRAPPRIRLMSGVLIVAALVVIPPAAGFNITIWTTAIIQIPLFLSVGLLARTSGQISLCQYTFAAIGAASFGHFAGEWHVPWLLALLIAVAITVPVGALVAIPAIRLPGVFLAVATLGLAIFVGNVVFATGWMFGANSSGVKVPQPHISVFGLNLNSTRGFYYLVLFIATLIGALVVAIEGSRIGRLLRALRDSPIVLEVQGLNVNVIRTVVFCISAAIAAVVGVLIGAQFQYALADQFQWFSSIQIVALVLIVGGAAPWYALIPAALQGLITGYVTSPNVGNWLSISFGAGAILYVYGVHRGRVTGLPVSARGFLIGVDRKLAFLSPKPKAVLQTPGVQTGKVSTDTAASDLVAAAIPARSTPTTDGSGLEVRDLTVDFGGVRALKSVSLRAPCGRITGLVGPNGAGKTTLFNSCSGLTRPTGGRVLFNDEDVTRLPRPRRAQLGLGRTFQRTQLFDSLTVRENVAVGLEAGMAGSNPLRQLAATRTDKVIANEAVAEALALTGIEDLSDRQAATLTTGQRRLIELARVLAGSFSMVMLDEPSAGLDSEETTRMGEVLRQVVEQRGVGILLVEHDVGLVRRVCEQIYVLDFGQLIFEGTPGEMLDSDVVKVAYLGAEVGTGIAGETEVAGGRS